jgi:Spy/CpxP family protein refolding chaperone
MKHHILVALILCSATAIAQQAQPPSGPPMGGPMNPPPGMGMPPHGGPQNPRKMDQDFFPPEMVMRNQKAINLTDDQQKSIKSEMQKSMSRFTELQWEQSAEEEKMQELVKADRPDEKKVLAQLDKLLDIENQMKRLHLTTMIRIKNILAPEQQQKLREMKRPQHGPKQGPPRGEQGRSPEDEQPQPPPPPPSDTE